MSIRKISNDLGLSGATVSWILSGQGEKRGFKEETIRRVIDYAESIQYSPNLVARNLSKGKTNTIGVIIPFIGDTFYANIVQAIESQTYNKSYTLTICSSEGDEKKEERLIKTLLGQRVDGIIIAPVKKTAKNIKFLETKKTPYVLIDRYFSFINSDYVTSNYYECGKLLTQKIVKQGAKKVALITTDTHLSEMTDREAGYKDALSEAGIEYNPDIVVVVDRRNYKEDCSARLRKMLYEHNDIDGILFTTHYLAIQSFEYFALNKIDYIERFVLAAIHKVAAIKLLAPNMSIAVVPNIEMGERAANILLQKIADGNSNTTYQEILEVSIE